MQFKSRRINLHNHNDWDCGPYLGGFFKELFWGLFFDLDFDGLECAEA
jgi:hypothetical protein